MLPGVNVEPERRMLPEVSLVIGWLLMDAMGAGVGVTIICSAAEAFIRASTGISARSNRTAASSFADAFIPSTTVGCVGTFIGATIATSACASI